MPFVPHPPQKLVLNMFSGSKFQKQFPLHLAVTCDYMSSINDNLQSFIIYSYKATKGDEIYRSIPNHSFSIAMAIYA